ncbi:extracellular solute-binding protein [Paenibacillus sp. F411]|uniref:extracellular solute-binding protein n=1 Tax=Paenibacillus sp. F411 TaxID=2820239 RepID=UPI001AAF66DB|nr:extracellular solute-binding protein [Paenibacillus sp. F411]MBO2942420.1 extracellular solute-binding protein [Paenibacillus sp. F411]
MYKKMYLSMLAVITAFTVAACSSGTTTEQADKGKSSDTGTAQTEQSQGPVEITMFVSDFSQQIPAGGNPTTDYMMEKTNTKLDIQYLPHADYTKNLDMKFAAQEYPDVYMNFGGLPSASLMEADMVLPLNDLIDQYGPNLKKNIPQEAWDAVTVNGQIISIPQPQVGNASAERLIYVRKDWLDKLGLDVPETSDEFLEMLRAFRDGDPNNNGQKDEIPFTMRKNFAWGDNIFGMWGVNPPLGTFAYYEDELIHSAAHPNTKNALEFIQTMYQEKLLDADFLTNERANWEQKIKSGTVGAWNHVAELAWKWQDDLNQALPNEKPEVIAIPTPQGAGYDGPVGRVHIPILKTYTIFKTSENPEAVIKMLDWLQSEEGQAFTEMGIEGDTYTVEGDKYVYNAEKDQPNAWREMIFKMHGYNEKIEQTKLSPEAAAKRKAAFEIAREEGIPNPAVGMPNSTILDNFDTSFYEVAAKIVLNNDSPDLFDQFIKDWRAQYPGWIEEATTWYNDNKK